MQAKTCKFNLNYKVKVMEGSLMLFDVNIWFNA